MNNSDKPAMPLQLQDGEASKTITKLGNADGLTKREFFAGLALQGLCSDPDMRDAETEAALAVRLADALLKELESPQP